MKTVSKFVLALVLGGLALGLQGCPEGDQQSEEPVETQTNDGNGSAEVGIDDSDPVEE